MACDSCWSHGDNVHSLWVKIKRTSSGLLIGCSGDGDSRDLEALVDKVKTPAQLPSFDALNKIPTCSGMLLVFPRSERIFRLDTEKPANETPGSRETPGLMEISFPHYAVGSGSVIARAAMDCGKNARGAVTLACRYDLYSRAPIHQLLLYPAARRSKK